MAKNIVLFLLIWIPVFLASCSHQYGLIKSGPEGTVLIPADFAPGQSEIRRSSFNGINLFLCSRSFSQGEAVYFELDAGGARSFSLRSLCFNGKPLSFSGDRGFYRGFFAIAPDEPAGTKYLLIEYSMPHAISDKIPFETRAAVFPFSKVSMDLGLFSDINAHLDEGNAALIKKASEKKKEVFSRKSPLMLDGRFSHPRNLHYVTSPFWSTRVIQQYRTENGKKIILPEKKRIHMGLDLRGQKGAPVFAMARGRIAAAEMMFYEGNMVIIDHGEGIFSYYMHLDSIRAREGRVVSPGDVIGYVGDTGVSTAPHLHVSFLFNGIHVDPLSVLFIRPEK